MVEELRIAGQPNPLDEFRFPWSSQTFDCLKIAGQPNGIDVLKIAGTLSDTDALKVVQNNDENTTNVSQDYETYFGEMEITNEEVDERIDTAKELEKVFLLLFALLLLLRNRGIDTTQEAIVQIITFRFEEAVKRLKIDLEIVRTYIDDIVPKIIQSTMRNFKTTTTTDENGEDRIVGANYFTSRDRAKSLAENEANSLKNKVELANAIAKGYKYKTWVTMKDFRVRHTHYEVDEVKVGIKEKFVVGDCLMLYPHDTENGTSEEVAGCRCVTKYTKD